MSDEDLHRRWHGIEPDDWEQQKKAASTEAVATVKETMAKLETTPPVAPAAPAAPVKPAVPATPAE